MRPALLEQDEPRTTQARNYPEGDRAIMLSVTADPVCPVHNIVHQERDWPVPCSVCRRGTTWHPHGVHPECDRRTRPGGTS